MKSDFVSSFRYLFPRIIPPHLTEDCTMQLVYFAIFAIVHAAHDGKRLIAERRIA
jgi:hypothetical protein